MKGISRIILGFIIILSLTSYNIVKHKRYNYYILDKRSFTFRVVRFDSITTSPIDTGFQNSNSIANSSKNIFVLINIWGRALLDTNLNKNSYSWKYMDKVFPIDTITRINLQLYCKKTSIPYKVVYIDNYANYRIYNNKYGIIYANDFFTSIKSFDEFKMLYNNRDSVMSYATMGSEAILLCELDLSNINFEDLNKDKLVANFIIEFSNGRKLAIKQTISIALKESSSSSRF